MAITLEQLDKILTHPNIVLEPIHEEDGKLNRDRNFTVFDQKYTIEWWCNISYLKTGGLMVSFTDVRQAGTWPNRAKLNLQFNFHTTDTMAVIPIEHYQTQEA